MSCLFIENADNTQMCGASTPACVEQTQESFTFVLDSKPKRRYRGNMTKKAVGPLIGITQAHLKKALARSRFGQLGHKGHTQLAKFIQRTQGIDTYQQAVQRVFEGRTREGKESQGGMKWPVVLVLQPELWEIAMEENDSLLKKELRTHGLQPKDDDVMTILGESRAGVGLPGYTFDLYEPWLAREDGYMIFPSQPTAKTLPPPPSFAHSPQAYAFRMIGDMMGLIYRNGDEVFVDPALPCRVGDDALFRNVQHSRSLTAHIVEITPEHYRVATRPDTRLEEVFELPVSEWAPHKIIGVRRGQ